MQKSTYSIILSDRVVDEIDRLAYRKGTSRSGLINEILAEYVSLTTPEKRISNTFDEIAALLYPGEVFREQAPPTASIMSMRAALAYKYNPTVRYTVELFRDPSRVPGGAQGVIRVSVRTTSAALMAELHRFYRLWAGVERRFGYPGEMTVEDGVLRRPILPRMSPVAAGHTAPGGDTRTGASLAAYISLLDAAMKLCLREPEDAAAMEGMSEMYMAYLNDQSGVV